MQLDFLDRLDPALTPVLAGIQDNDLSVDIPTRRRVRQQQSAVLRAALPEVPGVSAVDHTAPGTAGNPDVRVRLYEREDREPGTAALFWIHGGGMVMGAVEDDDFMCKTWAAKMGCLVASVEYRLAPEHQYPAHVDDCYVGLKWFASHAGDFGFDTERLVLGGASAGGGLAAGTALLARDRGEVNLAFQFLVYPMLDDRDITTSTREIDYPKVWNGIANRQCWRAYLGEGVGGADVSIYAAPARASVEDLYDLPPTYIDVGELDPFRDEDIAYATRLLQAGVACELHVTPGVFHGSETMALHAPSSKTIRGYRREALRLALA